MFSFSRNQMAGFPSRVLHMADATVRVIPRLQQNCPNEMLVLTLPVALECHTEMVHFFILPKLAEFGQHAFHLPAAHLLWMDVPAKWPIFLTWPVIKGCNKIVMLAGVKPTLVHFCCRQPSSNALRRFHSRLLSFCRYSNKKNPERKTKDNLLKWWHIDRNLRIILPETEAVHCRKMKSTLLENPVCCRVSPFFASFLVCPSYYNFAKPKGAVLDRMATVPAKQLFLFSFNQWTTCLLLRKPYCRKFTLNYFFHSALQKIANILVVKKLSPEWDIFPPL